MGRGGVGRSKDLEGPGPGSGRFASFLSGGFNTMAIINALEKKLANHTSARDFTVIETQKTLTQF